MRPYLKIDYGLLTDVTELTLTDKIIYSYVKSFIDDDKPFYASNNQIAKALGFSSRQVVRSINHLIETKWLYVDYKGDKGPKYQRVLFDNKNPNCSELVRLFNDIYGKLGKND